MWIVTVFKGAQRKNTEIIQKKVLISENKHLSFARCGLCHILTNFCVPWSLVHSKHPIICGLVYSLYCLNKLHLELYRNRLCSATQWQKTGLKSQPWVLLVWMTKKIKTVRVCQIRKISFHFELWKWRQWYETKE